MFAFDEAQIKRYSRHIILPEVGGKGQQKLLASKVLLIGMGGLGSPAALYLAAAGVGTLGLVDDDTVDLSNLQRQVVHSTGDLGRPKVDSAGDVLAALNPDIQVIKHPERLSAANAERIVSGYDLVVDGADNFPTRFLLNDACYLAGKPLVYGAVFRFEGQVSVFTPGSGPCYRCFIPEMPPPGSVPSCQEAGVLGVLPGTIGLLQATEVIKLILGIGKPLVGWLLVFDALDMEVVRLRLARDPCCPVCSQPAGVRALADYVFACEAGTGMG